jgi:hypothetical protein
MVQEWGWCGNGSVLELDGRCLGSIMRLSAGVVDGRGTELYLDARA